MVAVLTIAVVIFNTVLGLAVLLNNRREPLNISFSVMVFGIVAWTYANFATDNASIVAASLFWNRASFAFTSLLVAGLFAFVLLLTRQGPKLPTIGLSMIGLAGSAMFAICFSPFIVRGVELKSWGSNTLNGPLFSVFMVYFAVMVLGALGRMVAARRWLKGESKVQLQFFYFGAVLSIIVAVSTNLLLPVITGQTSLAKFGPLGTVFLVGFTAVAIVRHRLLDIRVLVLKSVAYTLTFALVVGGYVSFIYLFVNRLRLPLSRSILDIFVLLALVLTFQPLRRLLEGATNSIFFKGHYDLAQMILRLGDISKTKSRSVPALVASTIDLLVSEFHASMGVFLVSRGSGGVIISKSGQARWPRRLAQSLLEFAKESPEEVIRTDIATDDLEKVLLQEARLAILMPIRKGETTLAVLGLGEKKSGDPYSGQDVGALQMMAPQMAIAIENAKLFYEQEEHIMELRSLNKLFRHIEHFLDLDRLLEEVVDEAIKVTKAEGGSLMLYNKDEKQLSVRIARNLPKLIAVSSTIRMGEGISGTVAKMKHPVTVRGPSDYRFAKASAREDITSAISVPLLSGRELIGVLNVSRKRSKAAFSDESLNIMTAFAAQAAEAIVRTGYFEQIQKLSLENDRQFREFTRALARTVDAKDPYTYGHSDAVTRYAISIAQELKLDKRQRRDIEISGRLHDIGKIGISEYILNKPSRLSEKEFEDIKKHPEIAAAILKDMSSLQSIKQVILFHHERYGGGGYPTGIRGEEIPLGARILSVCDAFDTMTSDRAYRKSLGIEKARQELIDGKGTQFDPAIVDAFISIVDREGFVLSAHRLGHGAGSMDEELRKAS